MSTVQTQTKPVTAMEEYLFDLNGFVVLRDAIPSDWIDEANAIVDSRPDGMTFGDWWGNVHVHSFNEANNGVNLQQIYEAGEPFERLIDNPSWIEKVKHFVGGEGTFDYKHGPLFIDENFFSIRGPGEAIGMHSGAHDRVKRGQYRWHNGRFHCGQINILMAFTDIGPGDGATMVVPASHKANYQHPEFDKHKMTAGQRRSLEGVTGAIEVHLEKGDALLFVDALSHGSAARKNPGERRICVYRYGPSWGYFRFGYRPSDELMNRLTPERAQIVNPHHNALLPPERQR